MLSRDLSTLANGLTVWRQPNDGSLRIPPREARLLLSVLTAMAATAEAMEAVVVPSAARALPPDVTDLAAARRRKGGLMAAPRRTPTGGDAA